MTTRDYQFAQRQLRTARIHMRLLIYTAEYLKDARTNGFREWRERNGVVITHALLEKDIANAAKYAVARLGTDVILGNL